MLISFDIAGQAEPAPRQPAANRLRPLPQSRVLRKRRRSRTSSATAPRRAARVARSGGPAAAPRPPAGVDTAVLEAAPHDVIHPHEPIEALARAAALHAAGAQAREGARRRPRARRGDRRDRSDHPRRRRVLRGRGSSVARHGRAPAQPRRAARRRAIAPTPHPDPRGAQAHRRGDGAQRLHRAARDDLPHRRRHRHERADRVSASRPRARRATASASWPSPPRPCASRSLRHPGLNSRWDADAGEIVAAPLREPRHRRGDRARARGARTSATPRR